MRSSARRARDRREPGARSGGHLCPRRRPVRDHELIVDQPFTAGGDDDGPTPVELFVASLATCAASYAGRFPQRHHLPYDNPRVRAEFAMADDRPARVAVVRLRLMPPVRLSEARSAALRAVVSYRTVHNTLRQPPDVSTTVG
ncbi:OsmC family protein [Streptomyces sp. G45]|uniref:OsmC family protein n=1 Tax=Streptomyces sp. G45 TaxID=3406627 RepID=UPI003C208085